jgi:hypothetical protein
MKKGRFSVERERGWRRKKWWTRKECLRWCLRLIEEGNERKRSGREGESDNLNKFSRGSA